MWSAPPSASGVTRREAVAIVRDVVLASTEWRREAQSRATARTQWHTPLAMHVSRRHRSYVVAAMR